MNGWGIAAVTGQARGGSSLVLRLLLAGAIVLALVLALVGAAVDRSYRGASINALQERLEATVYLVLASIELDDGHVPVVSDSLAESRLDRPGSGLHAGAMTPYGHWQSPSLIGVIEPPRARLIERGQILFRGPEADGNWYVYAMGLGWEDADGRIIDLTIWAAEDPSRLEQAIRSFRGDLWRWLGLAALLVIAAQLLILLMLLKPLRQVSAEVGDIESGRRRRLDGRYPRELEPLTSNLNALLDTERLNAQRYRQALADLAHALKTPLAVLRARLEEDREVEPAQLVDSVDELDQLVRHQLERAARSTRATLHPPISVEPVVSRLAASIERLHRDRGVRIAVAIDPQLRAHIDERDLWEVCGNLIENAAKYGRGRVRVGAGKLTGGRHAGLELVVEDDGRGLDPERFTALVQRGMRGDERVEGQGLGLAICQHLVGAYGGRLALGDSSLGGAAIRVILPPR